MCWKTGVLIRWLRGGDGFREDGDFGNVDSVGLDPTIESLFTGHRFRMGPFESKPCLSHQRRFGVY